MNVISKWPDALFGGIAMPNVASEFSMALLRVYLGVVMAFAHGINKIPPPENFVGMVGGMGFPAPYFFALMAGITEFILAIFIALGLLVRPSALFLAFTMFVAAFIAHADDPFQRKELALTYLVMSIAFVFLGSGRWSLDSLIRSKFK